MLEPDVNTKGHMHWFYFKVITKLPKGIFLQCLLLIGTVLKFNIINLLRFDSFYRNGLIPMVYSES